MVLQHAYSCVLPSENAREDGLSRDGRMPLAGWRSRSSRGCVSSSGGADVTSAGTKPADPTAKLALLSRLGLCSTQMSTLMSVAGRLEAHVPAAHGHGPPPPWLGTCEQEAALQVLMAELVDSSCGSLTEAELEQTVVWFLRESNFDVAAAKQKLGTMMAWRQAHRLWNVPAEDVAAELATGKALAHAHPDVFGRPVLVVRAHKHTPGQFKLDDTRRLFTHICDEAIRSLPRGCDQLLGVVDLRGFSLAHVDLGFGAFVIEAFQVMYAGRAAQIVLVDAPYLFKWPWEMLKPLLRKYAGLVRFVSRAQLAADFFTPDTLPPAFAAK